MVPVLMLLMAALVAADEPMMALSEPAESVSVIHCDSSTICPDGTTCCLSPYGVWYCCPFSMGQCCRDGVHCCRHGYHCDSTSTHCLRGWLRLPSSPKPATKAIQKPQSVSFDQALNWERQTEQVHCDGNVYCPTEQFCCKSATGQWGCCSEMVL
ncbi:progranulin-like isoform X2 [Carassius carassius]|uniref:progranulin-like isoform X1 n=1 Tax=Carassius carassius TaxID=217509 RepID=UPI0028688106|nr:progranulin-like isoform X1 [Carassius carassius]XP_059412425.1 progranulin-like isoform X2 [Carassius carassius]